MELTDLEKRLDDLIKKVTERNEKTQEAKQSGPWGWVVGIVLALVSLVGIGVAMYLANKRAKELAKLKTQVEQEKVAQDQKAHEAKKVTLLKKRNELLDELKRKEMDIQKRDREIKEATQAHEERCKKVDALNAWREINEA
jgi:gas vesicle protein